MARAWRIRHKLMLGLGLVVAIMALLLGGTLIGLLSYMATMKMMDSKLVELQQANQLERAVNRLAAEPESKPDSPPPDIETQRQQLRSCYDEALKALSTYAAQLEDTVKRHRDPDGGVMGGECVDALNKDFILLDDAITNACSQQASPNGATQSLRHDPQVAKAITKLLRDTDLLQQVIYDDLARRSTVARGHYKLSLIMVISTSVVGLLLMAGLLRFFYGWVFYPVRDLQTGAGRVAQGDFEHRIDVHSGDEMEDLAAAFNNMTGRLREIYRDLNRQVNERSRQLVRSERLASVGFLAAGVAHEINNPLQAITLYSGALEARLAELVRRQPARPGTQGEGEAVSSSEYEVITKYLKTIIEEALRCKRITERLLEFSRGGEHHRELIDLTDLVQSVLDVAQPLPTCKGKEIRFEASGHVSAWANMDEIKSVMLNLVVNSLDSMDEGGTLTIRLHSAGDMAELELADTGCGMSADVLENIFEPFFTRSRSGKGTGLGLTISHRIITQHGGEIEADSPGPEQGSTFTVRLPLRPSEEAEQPTRPLGLREAEASPREVVLSTVRRNAA